MTTLTYVPPLTSLLPTGEYIISEAVQGADTGLSLAEYHRRRVRESLAMLRSFGVIPPSPLRH